MEITNTILYVVHMLSIFGILLLLLLQWNKNPRKLNPGVLHSALTALVVGIALVGVRHSLNATNATEWPLFDNTKIAVKLGIVLIILVIGYRNLKKPVLEKKIWLTLLGLTLSNILIATLWH
jgi:uncharacterized membrane protein YadS